VLADLPDNSVDLIFTDPPYNKEAVALYGDLAEFGARVLKPGGSLLAYCGQYALPQILVDMEGALRYWWMCACVHDGGNHKSLAGIKTYVLWKPIVWFVKNTNGADDFVYDAILRPAPAKTSHDWEQSLAEPLHYIEKLCPSGGLVCDPFAGGGTTQLAAERLGRRFVGAELNAEQEAIATGRQAA
jgi:site-specific DNA-methyltransferase (adenine-specific)